MPPPALPNLYALPSDVYDRLGIEGVDLRLDDHNQATGQKIQATADALAGATVLPVAALSYPLLKGSTLQFDGGGMPAQVQAVLSAVARVGDAQLAVNPLPAQVNSLAFAQDTGVNVATAFRLTKACQQGTIQVQEYCLNRYDDSQLVTSNIVNRWAIVLASRWLCRRRSQGCPKGLEAEAQEVLTELRRVESGSKAIGDCGTRTSGWPFISNITLDLRSEYVRVRVEPQISEGTPTSYAQYVDWNSVFAFGAYW
jgi:hypothetical protein